MNFKIALYALLFGSVFLAPVARAHDLPFSYIDLAVNDRRVDAIVEGSAKNFATAIGVEESNLLAEDGVQSRQQALFSLVVSRFALATLGKSLAPSLVGVEPVLSRGNIILRIRYAVESAPLAISVRANLFPQQPKQKIFLNIFRSGRLLHQDIFEGEVVDFQFALGERQSLGEVFRQFVIEGVHHIFIGPDHILFIIGLLLLGGNIVRWLKIVSAFTVAHSITLALATLNILNPSSRLVEPAIAISIIFVGAHAVLSKPGQRDHRLWLAFGFGLVHGFGFASVLREVGLPPQALGCSLFSFNVGVELGQAAIVLLTGPLLLLIRRASFLWSEHIVLFASLCIISAGGYWFLERVLVVT